jgi:nucleolar protein 6
MSVSKLTKKQKKGLAFRERKGKKLHLESDALLEEDLAVPQADPPVEEAAEHNTPVAQTKAVAKPKKRNRDAEQSAEDEAEEAKAQVDARVEDSPRKGIKRRKLNDEGNDDNAKAAKGKTRFILFVGTYLTHHSLCPLKLVLGNLKYTTSLDAIQEHFASCGH